MGWSILVSRLKKAKKHQRVALAEDTGREKSAGGMATLGTSPVASRVLLGYERRRVKRTDSGGVG